MKVLVLVDIQNDFCPGGALAVPGGDQVVPVANALIASGAFDLVIATKDWHPASHVSFADNHPGRSLFEQIEVAHGTQTLWPRHCVQGSMGADLHPRMILSGIHHVVEKGTDWEIDSYSGFYDNKHLKETPLRALIEKESVRRGVPAYHVSITVCGLALDYCVAATARDAASLGYKTEVVVDACRAVNLTPGDDVRTLRQLAQAGVGITTSAELVPERARTRGVEIQP
jgi:nicotinamidase/pyrazinamidase